MHRTSSSRSETNRPGKAWSEGRRARGGTDDHPIMYEVGLETATASPSMPEDGAAHVFEHRSGHCRGAQIVDLKRAAGHGSHMHEWHGGETTDPAYQGGHWARTECQPGDRTAGEHRAVGPCIEHAERWNGPWWPLIMTGATIMPMRPGWRHSGIAGVAGSVWVQ